LQVQGPVCFYQLLQLYRDGPKLTLPCGFHIVQNPHDRLDHGVTVCGLNGYRLRGPWYDADQGIGYGTADLLYLGYAVLHAGRSKSVAQPFKEILPGPVYRRCDGIVNDFFT